jgi:hypothetical protein
MGEYRPTSPDEQQQPGAGTMAPRTGEIPRYMRLAEQYGLSDMVVGESHRNEQTIVQEYQAYITAPPSPRDVDILKFWEVGNNVVMLSYYSHRRYRFTAMLSLPSLR